MGPRIGGGLPARRVRPRTRGGGAADRHGTYALGRTAGHVRDTWFRLAARVDREPVAGTDGTAFRWMTRVLLYRDEMFPQLAGRLAAVAAGRPPTLDQPGDQPPPAPPDSAAMAAVTCNDTARPRATCPRPTASAAPPAEFSNRSFVRLGRFRSRTAGGHEP
ncbi:hypothetical protein [Spongiactinospora sp. 9N601]|uniref:hypothetical protein n=1 Tax=Spongiactinospora sp. 9N601 TaxID=3375149 RepID=UPI0037A11C45